MFDRIIHIGLIGLSVITICDSMYLLNEIARVIHA